MVKLASSLSRLSPVDILVVGDLLLDMYTVGKVRRVSPEAPVAVVHVSEEECRPGGAGNVALNLVSLGARVRMVGRVGTDWAGDSLKSSFELENVDVSLLFPQNDYKTPVKNRIIADNQQIVRVDYEKISPLPSSLEQTIIKSLPEMMKNIGIIAISDYGKGFLTTTLLRALIGKAKELGIPIIADPKGHDFIKYFGVTVIKPNLSEAYVAANLPMYAPIEQAASHILESTGAETLMVTRSEAGITLFETSGGRHDFPVQMKQVKDVTGAGDTVLAMLTYALANNLSCHEAAQLCNVAAGISIERIGCARVSMSDLAHRLLEYDVGNKIFDEEHLFALQEVLRSSSFKLLIISEVEEMSQGLFKAIRSISQDNVGLLVYLPDLGFNESFTEILASLKEVHFIMLHQDNLRRLCSGIQPVECYVFEPSGLRPIELERFIVLDVF